jgi:hypothetical protein
MVHDVLVHQTEPLHAAPRALPFKPFEQMK